MPPMYLYISIMSPNPYLWPFLFPSSLGTGHLPLPNPRDTDTGIRVDVPPVSVEAYTSAFVRCEGGEAM